MAFSRLLLLFALVAPFCDAHFMQRSRNRVRKVYQDPGVNHTHPEVPFRRDGWLRFEGSTERPEPVTVDLEIPDDYDHFMQGLMYRSSFSENMSMLFAWNEDGPRPFWMENTWIPLDMVWVNHDKEIVDIKQALANDLSSVKNDRPAQYVFELGEGWCGRHGVKVGDRVSFEHESDRNFFVAMDR